MGKAQEQATTKLQEQPECTEIEGLANKLWKIHIKKQNAATI